MRSPYRVLFDRLWVQFLQWRRLPSIPQSVLLEPPLVGDAQYETIFGSDVGAGIAPWNNSLPSDEFQGSTGDCVSHSRTNAWETTWRYLHGGEEKDLSELYLAVGSNTSLRGNSLRAVSEFFRINGTVLDELCDYTPDMLTNPAGTWLQRAVKFGSVPKNAQRFLGGTYSALPTHVPSIAKALPFSPVQIAVGLGETYRLGGVIQKPQQISTYHAILAYEITDAIYVVDSIAPTRKRFALNYPLVGALSFRDLPDDWKAKNNDGIALVNRLKGRYLMRVETEKGARGELYHLLPDGSRLVKIDISISYEALRGAFNTYLRLQEKFLGIDEANFATLVTAIREAGGVIDQ